MFQNGNVAQNGERKENFVKTAGKKEQKIFHDNCFIFLRPEKSWVNHILVVQFMYLITCLNYIP